MMVTSNEAKGGEKMRAINKLITATDYRVLIALVWIFGALCCLLMKKIQPETIKLYIGYAIGIAVISTWVLILIGNHVFL